MTDRRISEHTANTSIADGDLFEHVDISDTTDAATGTNKKVTGANLWAYMLTKLLAADGTGSTIDADLLDGQHASAFQPIDADLTTLATVFTTASASGPATLALHEDTDNGSNKVTLSAPASVASDVTVTMPGSAGTLALTTDTVLQTLADAKGDLIVASAADAFTRLAVGTNDYVLTADSAQSTGVKWAAASGGGVAFTAPALSGQYYPVAIAPLGAISATTLTANQIWYFPWVVDGSCTLDELWVEVTTNQSGKSIMMAVYTANSTWHPVALVGGGSVSATTTGMKKVTGINTAMTAGRYLLALNCNDSTIAVRYTTAAPLGWGSTSDFNTSSKLTRFHASETFSSSPNASPTDWTTIDTADAYYLFCHPLVK